MTPSHIVSLLSFFYSLFCLHGVIIDTDTQTVASPRMPCEMAHLQRLAGAILSSLQHKTLQKATFLDICIMKSLRHILLRQRRWNVHIRRVRCCTVKI